MSSLISRYIRFHPVKTQRGLEILSGLFPWLIILFPFIGSFFIPETVAYFIIAFNSYWLYKSTQTGIYAISGYLNIKATEKIDWQEKINADPELAIKVKKIWSVVIIPNVKEPINVLERNLNSLANQTFPTKQMAVVLAMEDRARGADGPKARELYKKFKGKFGELIVTYHPIISGETIGKHSNNTYAAKEVKKILVGQKGTAIENILLSTTDADTVWPKQYFSLLAYKFLTAKKPYNSFFQAPIFMYNNLRRLPFLVRIPAIVGGIGYLALIQKASGRSMNWSTYSTSLKLLHTVGYWDVDVIPEDWHINLKAFFQLKGDVTLIPMFLPVHIDAAESVSRWKTFYNTYEQEKRWAWGVVDITYVIKNFFLHPEIPIWDRLMKLSLTIEWHFSWSSSWFWITLGATIPTVLNPAFARTSLGYSLPQICSLLLTFCLFGVLIMTIVDTLLDPSRKNKLLHLLHPLNYLQWVLLPISGLLFGSLPGLESQTRLMLGKYIGYRVTEKV